MKTLSRLSIGAMVCCCLATAGCAPKRNAAPVAKEPEIALSCIAVLPTQAAVELDGEGLPPDEGSGLEKGRIALDNILQEQLAGKARVRFVPGEEFANVPDGSTEQGLEESRQLAGAVGCNAVLETVLLRYDERVGTPYGVREPAAVTFLYRLFATENGQALCQGRFDEKQQAAMDNLFNLGKVKERGLVWLTAEELMRSGVKEKLLKCPYLK